MTAGLRREVLRPNDLLPLLGDDDPTALHLAAYDTTGRVVACGNLRPAPPPFDATQVTGRTAPQAWRLRGMATAEGERGNGAGAAVLAGLLDLALRHGAELVWCNARLPAQRFYERAGLQAWGEPWDDPAIGPHIVMWTSR